MAVLAAAGSFNVTTAAAGNTVSVSGLTDGDTGAALGTPKLVFFWWNGRTASTDGVERATQNMGFGAAVHAAMRWATGSRSADAAASAVADTGHSDVACIISLADGAIDGAMDLQTMDVGGFTLIIDDAFPTDLRVSFLALGGDIVATLGIFTATGTAPVTQAVAHGLVSTPAAILLCSAGATNAPPNTGIDSPWMLGAMTGASGEGVVLGGSNDGSNTMVTAAYAISTECIATKGGTPDSVNTRAEFSSIDGTNFTINWLERVNDPRVFFCAIGGPGVQALVGSLTTQTDTTTDINETVGFRPKAILFGSACRAESTADTPTAHGMVSVGGAASATQRSAQAALDEDAIGTSEVNLASEYDEVYINISTAGTVQGLMDLKSVSATGFTCIMDDADPSGSFVWYLALGYVIPPLSPVGMVDQILVPPRVVPY